MILDQRVLDTLDRVYLQSDDQVNGEKGVPFRGSQVVQLRSTVRIERYRVGLVENVLDSYAVESRAVFHMPSEGEAKQFALSFKNQAQAMVCP